MLHVREEALAGLFAVIPDVDPDCVLLCDRVSRGSFDGLSEFVSIDRLAAAATTMHLRERSRTGEAARVRGQDARHHAIMHR
jgi:hypothetical protein